MEGKTVQEIYFEKLQFKDINFFATELIDQAIIRNVFGLYVSCCQSPSYLLYCLYSTEYESEKYYNLTKFDNDFLNRVHFDFKLNIIF